MFSQRLVDSKIQKNNRFVTRTVFVFATGAKCLRAAGAKRCRRQAPQACCSMAPNRKLVAQAQRGSRALAPHCDTGAKRRKRQAPQATSAAGAKRRRRQAPQACCSMAPNRKLVAQAQRRSRALTRRGVYMFDHPEGEGDR